jgi:hypothetical protein
MFILKLHPVVPPTIRLLIPVVEGVLLPINVTVSKPVFVKTPVLLKDIPFTILVEIE